LFLKSVKDILRDLNKRTIEENMKQPFTSLQFLNFVSKHFFKALRLAFNSCPG
jgi:hypothetical protein